MIEMERKGSKAHNLLEVMPPYWTKRLANKVYREMKAIRQLSLRLVK